MEVKLFCLFSLSSIAAKYHRLFSHSFLLPFSYLPTALYTAKTDKHFELYNDSFYRLEAAARGAL